MAKSDTPHGPDRDELYRFWLNIEHWLETGDEGYFDNLLGVVSLAQYLLWNLYARRSADSGGDTAKNLAGHHLRLLVVDAVQVIQPVLPLGRFDESTTRIAHAVFIGHTRNSVAQLLKSAAQDAHKAELGITGYLMECDDLLVEFDQGEFSTLTAAIVLLGLGESDIAKSNMWPEPLELTRTEVAAQANRLGPVVVDKLVRRHHRYLLTLARRDPFWKAVMLLRQFERAGNRKLGWPGQGFAVDRVLAELFSRNIKAIRPQWSRLTSDWLDINGEIPL
jgi:hypothetical protein